jgi:hypothetical protein
MKIKPVNFAAKMAAQWSDEFLLSKKPEDLMTAYGCDLRDAKYVLNNELTKRKICR